MMKIIVDSFICPCWCSVCNQMQSPSVNVIITLPPHRADIALIGLAVMGQNLIMNMNDHGFVVR